jgi:signal transduction histidine kinase
VVTEPSTDQAVQRARLRAAKLHEVAAALSQSARREEVAAIVVGRALEVLGAQAAVAYFTSEDGSLRYAASHGVPEETAKTLSVLPLDAPLPLATAIQTRQPVWLETYEALIERYPSAQGARTPRTSLQAVAALPLVSGGRVIGGLAFSFGEPQRFDEDDRTFLLTLAEHASLALERARLLDEERTARDRITILEEAGRKFAEAKLDLQEILDTVTREVATRMGDSCAINLLSEDGETLELLAVCSTDPALSASVRKTIAAAPVLKNGESTLARVARSGQPVLTPEVPFKAVLASSLPEHRAHLERYPIHSLLVVPLRVQEAIIGTMTLARGVANSPYTRQDQALLQDLADRAAFAIANGRLFREAQAAIAVRDDFLSIAGHELKTPLAALQLQIQGLLHQARKEHLADRFLERLVKTEGHVTRLDSLIGELLDVSRITRGRLTIQREAMDLAALVSEVTDRLAASAAAAGCTLTVQAPASIAGAWDRLRIEQVLTNLLDNAIKYGAGHPIRLSAAVAGDVARISVRDHGIGISPGDEERIFGRFERAVSQRHYGGFGLGLWIARQIVEAHGGNIRFERPAGEGTLFIVDLPLAPPEP